MPRVILMCIGCICFCWQLSAQNIVEIEYSIDKFVKEGSGTSISLSGDATLADELLNIDVSTLESGNHTLYIRSLNEDGVWSMPVSKNFYVNKTTELYQNDIVKLQYSFDAFINEENGNSVDYDNDYLGLNDSLNIDISGLETGNHTLYIRALNSVGNWSMPVSKTFYLTPDSKVKVEEIHYRFTNESYIGDWQQTDVTPPSEKVDSTLMLNISELTLDEEYEIEFYAKNEMGVRGFSAITNSFLLRVNHPPQAEIALLEASLSTEEQLSVSLDTLFNEEDLMYGDSLFYSVSDPLASGINEFINWTDGKLVTFSPTNEQAGNYTFWFIAEDIAGEADSVEYNLTVKNENNVEPEISTSISDVALEAGFGSQNIDVEEVFNDPDGDELEITASSENEEVASVEVEGNILTIVENGEGTTIITVFADDGNGGITEVKFTITIEYETNENPVLANVIADQTFTATQEFSFTIPENTFDDPDGDDLTYSVTLSDGSPLPSWLTFDEETMQLIGTPPESAELQIAITVTDDKGGSVSTEFKLTIEEVTGIEDELLKAATILYPNPNNGQFQLELNNEYYGKIEIKILGIEGKEYDKQLFNKKERTFSKDLNLQKINSGMYLLHLKTDKAKAVLRFFIKN